MVKLLSTENFHVYDNIYDHYGRIAWSGEPVLTIKDRVDGSSDAHHRTLKRFAIQKEIQFNMIVANTLEEGEG